MKLQDIINMYPDYELIWSVHGDNHLVGVDHYRRTIERFTDFRSFQLFFDRGILTNRITPVYHING